MGDSIANTLGKKVKVTVDGVEYEVEPITLGILSDAESELINRERPVKDQLEELVPLATVMPDYVREKADKIIARQKSIPPGEVIEWVTSSVEGIGWSMAKQLELTHPEKFKTGELSVAKVVRSCYERVETEMANFYDEVSKRNQASELEDPPKNPSGPSESRAQEQAEPEVRAEAISTVEEPSNT